MREFLASQLFRLLLVPCATAGLGSFIRYFTAKLKREKITLEIFVVWPELLMAAVFNLLLGASDLAAKKENLSDQIMGIFAACLLLMLILWIVSLVAGLPRQGKWRIAIWTYTFPHFVAIASLEISLLLVSASLGAAIK